MCECYMDMEDSDPEQMQKPKLENNDLVTYKPILFVTTGCPKKKGDMRLNASLGLQK